MNSKIFVPFKKLFKLIIGIIDKCIVTPISTIVYKLQLKFGKESRIEKLLNRPHFLLYLSLVFAIFLFYLVENKAVKLVNTDAEYLTNQKVKVLYNSSAYVVEGVPESVDITLIGKKSQLYLAKQLGDNEVVVDLTDYEPSDKPVKVKLTYNKNLDNIDYKIDPTYITVTIKKKVNDTKTISYDLLNQDLLDPKLSVRSVELSQSSVVVRGSEDTLNDVATVKALIDLSNKDYTKAGTYAIDNVKLVAYGKEGEVIDNVEIAATKITATLILDSFSKKVPVKVVTEGKLVDGKAISSITINGKAASEYEVTVYGDEDALEKVENISVPINIQDLGNSGSKTFNVSSLPRPNGVRTITDESVSIVLNFGEAKQKTISVVGIKTINVPSGLVANLASADDMNVEVQVIGVASVIDALGDNPSGITAYVDLSGMTAGGPRSVDVKVTGDDSRLQYIVTKKVNVVLSKGN